MVSDNKAVLITDDRGRVLAAQFPLLGETRSKEQPTVGHLVALGGQRVFEINLPREAAELSGPDLHRYFAEVKINPDGQVKLPKIKIERMHKK